MDKGRLQVIQEDENGRNIRYLDTFTGKKHKESVARAMVKSGIIKGYHTVKEKGKEEYIRSNPDGNKKNNLG